MNMSSNQTMSLSGVALASASEDCETSAGKLLRIIEVMANEQWYLDVEELVVDEDTCVIGATPVIYAKHSNGTLTRCDLDNLIYRTAGGQEGWQVMSNAFVFADNTYFININRGDGSGFLEADEEVGVYD